MFFFFFYIYYCVSNGDFYSVAHDKNNVFSSSSYFVRFECAAQTATAPNIAVSSWICCFGDECSFYIFIRNYILYAILSYDTRDREREIEREHGITYIKRRRLGYITYYYVLYIYLQRCRRNRRRWEVSELGAPRSEWKRKRKTLIFSPPGEVYKKKTFFFFRLKRFCFFPTSRFIRTLLFFLYTLIFIIHNIHSSSTNDRRRWCFIFIFSYDGNARVTNETANFELKPLSGLWHSNTPDRAIIPRHHALILKKKKCFPTVFFPSRYHICFDT